jgi:hypothetical protein
MIISVLWLSCHIAQLQIVLAMVNLKAKQVQNYIRQWSLQLFIEFPIRLKRWTCISIYPQYTKNVFWFLKKQCKILCILTILLIILLVLRNVTSYLGVLFIVFWKWNSRRGKNTYTKYNGIEKFGYQNHLPDLQYYLKPNHMVEPYTFTLIINDLTKLLIIIRTV